MKGRRPFREGEVIEVTPARLGKRGEAEADFDGWRVRVQGAIPGEAARVRVLHVSKGGPVASARFLAPAEAPHPARREAPCPIHDTCGGCGLQHVGEEAALDAKIEQARALLPGAEWREPIRSPLAFGYRCKTFLLPQRRGGHVMFGARPPRGDRLVDTTGCAVLRPALENVAARVRATLHDRIDLAEHLRSVLLRCNRKGETIVTLVHSGGPGPLAELRFGAQGHYLQRHDAPGNRICSDEEEVLVAGPPGGIAERFGDVEVTIPPTAFWQANADVAEALYGAAAAALEGERLAELYCGAGAAGLLALARRPGAALEGVDRAARAIESARATARARGLEARARFVVGGAEAQAGAWDAVLVNPPRAGCHAAVLEAVARSDARRLVYLSCNPATLARDAAALGWKLDWVQPADMLPQTPHLELLALLTRP